MLHVRLPTASFGQRAERHLFLVEVEVHNEVYDACDVCCVTLGSLVLNKYLLKCENMK